MKEQIIQIPDTLEIKEIRDGKIILVEKEKKLTYADIAKSLFSKHAFFIGVRGDIEVAESLNNSAIDLTNCTSRKQAKKLLAINKLMNVAKYLNGDWQPNWSDTNGKSFIAPNHETNRFDIEEDIMYQNSYIYFKSKELAEQAIEILGEETIRLALCTDY